MYILHNAISRGGFRSGMCRGGGRGGGDPIDCASQAPSLGFESHGSVGINVL